jgi:hypothetical protein
MSGADGSRVGQGDQIVGGSEGGRARIDRGLRDPINTCPARSLDTTAHRFSLPLLLAEVRVHLAAKGWGVIVGGPLRVPGENRAMC